MMSLTSASIVESRMSKWQKVLLVAYHIAVTYVIVSNAMAR